VLAANAGPEVLAQYDAELDAAFVKAREDGDLTVLTATVRRWWFEADAWREPEAQRTFLARVDGYVAEGPPPPGQRMTWQEFRARPSAETSLIPAGSHVCRRTRDTLPRG
jgi:hypothetical protein